MGKKQFIITLPKQLYSKGRVEITNPCYLEIPKIGLSIAGTAAEAVTRYLHRDGVCPVPGMRNAIVSLVKVTAGKNHSLDDFAFEVPEVEAIEGKPFSIEQKRDYQKYALAESLAKVYKSTPEKYLSEARKVLAHMDPISNK